MNNGIAESRRYAEVLTALITQIDTDAVEIYVLPPFTSLTTAITAFTDSPVGVGGQNMHWEDSGSWTGEISAPMLSEIGCRYVELAHSERLQHFGETYELARRKVDKAMSSGLIPIVCLGETALDKAADRADEVLADQLKTSIAGQANARVPEIIFAYEPRWAISASEAASPDYVAERHHTLREVLRKQCGDEVAQRTRIIYGGSVTPENGRTLLDIDDVDGLFVGRAAWKPEGFARIVELVAEAAARRKAL